MQLVARRRAFDTTSMTVGFLFQAASWSLGGMSLGDPKPRRPAAPYTSVCSEISSASSTVLRMALT
jgi:hypothetical protein